MFCITAWSFIKWYCISCNTNRFLIKIQHVSLYSVTCIEDARVVSESIRYVQESSALLTVHIDHLKIRRKDATFEDLKDHFPNPLHLKSGQKIIEVTFISKNLNGASKRGITRFRFRVKNSKHRHITND